MTIQELIQKITESVLSEEAKHEIINLANTYSEVTFDLEKQVKDLIQQDIDRDLAILEAEIEDTHSSEEDSFSNMSPSHQEEELNALRAEIARAEEALKIEQLRNDLTIGS